MERNGAIRGSPAGRRLAVITKSHIRGVVFAVTLGAFVACAASIWVPAPVFAVVARLPGSAPGWRPEMRLVVSVFVASAGRGQVEVAVRSENGCLHRTAVFDCSRERSHKLEISDLVPGAYLVEATAPGLESERRLVSCPDGYVHEVQISLEREQQRVLLVNDTLPDNGSSLVVPLYEGQLPCSMACVLRPGEVMAMERQGKGEWPTGYLKLAHGAIGPTLPEIAPSERDLHGNGKVLKLSNLRWAPLNDSSLGQVDGGLRQLADRALLELGLAAPARTGAAVEIISGRPFRQWLAVDCALHRVAAVGIADERRGIHLNCDHTTVVLEYGDRGLVAGVGACWPLASGHLVVKNVQGVLTEKSKFVYCALPADADGRYIACEVLPADRDTGVPLGRWLEVPQDGLVWTSPSPRAIFKVRRLLAKGEASFRYEPLWLPELVGPAVHVLPALPLGGLPIPMPRKVPPGIYWVRDKQDKYVATLDLKEASQVGFADFPMGPYTVIGPNGTIEVELAISDHPGSSSSQSLPAAGDANPK